MHQEMKVGSSVLSLPPQMKGVEKALEADPPGLLGLYLGSRDAHYRNPLVPTGDKVNSSSVPGFGEFRQR